MIYKYITHLKDSDPSVADVIEVYGSLERIDLAGGTVGVILVPVHTGCVISAVISHHV